jgi:fused signal recognition particle receptor
MFDFFRKKTPKTPPEPAAQDIPEAASGSGEESPKAPETQETPKKKGFFSFLFSSKPKKDAAEEIDADQAEGYASPEAAETSPPPDTAIARPILEDSIPEPAGPEPVLEEAPPESIEPEPVIEDSIPEGLDNEPLLEEAFSETSESMEPEEAPPPEAAQTAYLEEVSIEPEKTELSLDGSMPGPDEAAPVFEDALQEAAKTAYFEDASIEPDKTEPVLDGSLPEPAEAGPVFEEFAHDVQAPGPVKDTSPADAALAPACPQAVGPEEMPPEGPEEAPAAKKGWFSRLKDRLSSTREKITGRLEKVLASSRSIDDTVLEELEEILFTSDLGVPTTLALLDRIKTKVARKELKDADALKGALRDALIEMLDVPQKDLVPDLPPRVILVVGVNGVGKTTTIAKLARTFTKRGQKVMLAAGDTFRAAAVEQLKIWSGRLGTDFVAQASGADPAAVVFDAITAAKARKTDVVIIDTAGRLHTKVNLMEELKKVKRASAKALPGAPHETILVLDANTGQNASRQAQTFHEAIGVDSIIVTKLDGTSKGGVVVSISYEHKIPVIFIGIGESYEDLKPFDSREFVSAILGLDPEKANGHD